jgi:uncharacterized protein YcbK (DUF882 family)
MAKEFIEPDWDDFPNFSRSEFACQHCGRAEMDDDFMWRLQDLRSSYGKPMRITSGYRCPEHPIEAAKAKPGTHATGRAVDVAVSHGQAYALLRLAMRMGFTGVGIQQKGDGRFIHLDDITPKEDFDGKKFVRPMIWSY